VSPGGRGRIGIVVLALVLAVTAAVIVVAVRDDDPSETSETSGTAATASDPSERSPVEDPAPPSTSVDRDPSVDTGPTPRSPPASTVLGAIEAWMAQEAPTMANLGDCDLLSGTVTEGVCWTYEGEVATGSWYRVGVAYTDDSRDLLVAPLADGRYAVVEEWAYPSDAGGGAPPWA